MDNIIESNIENEDFILKCPWNYLLLPCPKCEATGKQYQDYEFKEVCSLCKGDGEVTQEEFDNFN